MIQVKESIHKKVAEITAWSMTYAAMGVAPTAGFEGESFELKSFRAEMAGKELAGGFRKLGHATLRSHSFDQDGFPAL